MILVLAATLASAAPQAPRCPELVTADALVCRALDAQRSGDAQSAAEAFEEAAKASPDKEARTARLYAAAGNMWIAARQPGKAALDLDKALAIPGLEGEQRGQALLDRARAAEAQDDLATARARFNAAVAIIADDPFAWYFSASLAIRENDLATAQQAIARALSLAPNDPAIQFEAGHVAHVAGDDDKARSYWSRAAASDKGAIGAAAAKAIEMLGVTPTVKLEGAAPK